MKQLMGKILEKVKERETRERKKEIMGKRLKEERGREEERATVRERGLE